MPEPNDVHVDQVLTGMSVQYKNASFIANQVLPIVSVKKESDKYYIYDKRDRFAVPNTLRAPKTESKQASWNVGTDDYSCEEHALNDLIDDREYANADKPLDVKRDTIENLTDLLLLAQEKRVADLVFSTTNITNNTTLTGTDQWNDAANSDPIGDIVTAKQTVHSNIFLQPNTLILGKEVFDILTQHPDILDRYKWTKEGIITADMLAKLFGFDRVLVGEAGYDSANEGQTEDIDYVWGKDALIAYIEPRPSLRRPSLGYTFQARPFQVRSARIETKHSDWFETSHVVDENLVAVDCAYLIKDAVA
jgi:hypothetical protein